MSETEQSQKPDDTTTQVGGPGRVKKISTALFERRRPTKEEIATIGGCLIGKIYGEATGFRTTVQTDPKTNEEQTFTVLTGRFWADRPGEVDKNGVVGEGTTVESGTCFLPGGFHEDMLDHIAPIGEAGERKYNGNTVRFAYQIVNIPRGESAYAYEIRPIMEKKRGEPGGLLHTMQNEIKAAELKIAHAKQIEASPDAKGKSKEKVSEFKDFTPK